MNQRISESVKRARRREWWVWALAFAAVGIQYLIWKMIVRGAP